MRLAPCLTLAFVCGTGCAIHRSGKHSIEYASVPFEYGTNAVLELDTQLQAEGSYNLYLLLRDQDLPRSANHNLPFTLPTRFHVIVQTNDQVMVDEEVTELQAVNCGSGHVNYDLKWIGFIRALPRMKCRVSDLSDGKIRARGSLNLQLYRGH
jgi:hypothetical protein